MRSLLILVLSIFMFSCDNETENHKDSDTNKNVGTIIIRKETSVSKGYDLFTQNCAVCHSLGTGNITGPGLKGIKDRVPQPYSEWLHKYIKNNLVVLKSGDAYAQKVFAASGNAAMTVFDGALSDEQINCIIDFIVKPDSEMRARNPDVAK